MDKETVDDLMLAKQYGDILRDVFAAVEICLFGSYLKKCAHEYLDIDFAIISRNFAGIEAHVAMKILQRLKSTLQLSPSQ